MPLLYADDYTSPTVQVSLWRRLFPSLSFYSGMSATIYGSSKPAKSGSYSREDWVHASHRILFSLEKTGGRLVVEGVKHFHNLEGPCVFVGNHMSSLETMLLPAILQPWKPITFVIKESLMNYPFFGSIMRTCDPVIVGRSNPREDLATVLNGGLTRLQRGTSIVVFPQSTRMETFDSTQFNTIGIKLARKAKVPVVPLALRTDFWGNGTLIREFGPVRPERTVYMRFGKPLEIQGAGKAEHETIIAFIQNSLAEWDREDMKALEA